MPNQHLVRRSRCTGDVFAAEGQLHRSICVAAMMLLPSALTPVKAAGPPFANPTPSAENRSAKLTTVNDAPREVAQEPTLV
ncbi:hypothetical protein ASD76_08480 [Altererythrobacter sp. Root672]|nr:hypothetical protein ASD76_08480 [Altererythrobacter sp. Root672]